MAMRFQTLLVDGNGAGDDVSLAAVLAALVPSVTSAFLFLGIFVLIKKYFRRIYSPRTYIDSLPEKDRTPSESTSRLAWMSDLAKLDDRFLVEHSSLDAYLYLRFLRTIILICFAGVCIAWPVLLPVNATGGGTATQLDKFGFGNVRRKDRLYAHALVAWVLFGFVMFVIARERVWLIGLRQAWYLSESNASRLSSRTVLYLEPPRHESHGGHTQSQFGDEAIRQWPVVSTSKLDDLINSRHTKAMKLESAQTTFIQRADRKRLELARNHGSCEAELHQDLLRSLRPRRLIDLVDGDREDDDTIRHYRKSTKKAADEIEQVRASVSAEADDSQYAVFVEYRTQAAAQREYRGRPRVDLPIPPNLKTQERLLGVLPQEIIWSNLTMPHAERIGMKSTANILIAALIIFWSIPSAFIGTISNVRYLAETFEWLGWIKDLPEPILAALTGFIPPLINSELSSYVPVFMRYVAVKFGEPTIITAELQVQAWYYCFQIIQVFLVTALSASATVLIPRIINDPHQIPLILADKLPTSSNFYLTYFIVQGLGSSTQNMLNYSDLLEYYVWEKFLNKTAREKYEQYINLKGIGWGKAYPKFTNFAVIALAYSCVSPLVLGFATIGLVLFYLSYRYNLMFIMQPKMETRGRCYTRALQQILTGVYIGELVLIGLFSLRQAPGPSILIAILLGVTVVYNVVSNRHLSPLEDHFPDDLLAAEGENDPLLTEEEGQASGEHEADEHSGVQSLARNVHIPLPVRNNMARFFEPHIHVSRKAIRSFLARRSSDAGPPSYTEEQLRTAYMSPSLKSKTPVIWLPADVMGLSKEEVEENKAAEILSTDRGAWLDGRSRVRFDKYRLRDLPVWKEQVVF